MFCQIFKFECDGLKHVSLFSKVEEWQKADVVFKHGFKNGVLVYGKQTDIQDRNNILDLHGWSVSIGICCVRHFISSLVSQYILNDSLPEYNITIITGISVV